MSNLINSLNRTAQDLGHSANRAISSVNASINSHMAVQVTVPALPPGQGAFRVALPDGREYDVPTGGNAAGTVLQIMVPTLRPPAPAPIVYVAVPVQVQAAPTKTIIIMR